jgi:acyl CoA:acetate/3-ketoacid CoA transferase alpha subunit
VTFNVTASGGTLSYQWRKGGTNIDGATGTSYTLNSVTTGDAGSYDCVVTNGCGSLPSNAATLTVNTVASISGHPQSATRCAGQSVTFNVTASGSGTLTYQWRKGGTNINGATGTSYTLNSVTAGDAGSYDCVVTNGCGSVPSNAATLTVNTVASISGHPQSATRCAGQSVTFNVTASGSGTLTYQWRKGGTNIDGATGTSYTLNSVATGDAGSYDCVVTNGCGSVPSNAATLTVNTGPQISGQPADQTIVAGNPVSFAVTATGSGTLTYQWRKGGTDIDGATASTYTIDAVTAGDAGSYDCVVTNGCGSVPSNAATLTVTPAVCLGDANCDGTITWRDIDYLITAQNDNQSGWAALFPAGPTCSFANLDLNGDGQVNWRDIDPFIARMNTNCP